MPKVSALYQSGITPSVVLNSVGEHIEKIKQLFVVAIEDDGKPTVWASGDLSGLPLAALSLHDLALKELQEKVYTE